MPVFMQLLVVLSLQKIRTRSFYSLQKRNNHFKHSIKIAYVKAYSFGKGQQTILLNNG